MQLRYHINISKIENELFPIDLILNYINREKLIFNFTNINMNTSTAYCEAILLGKILKWDYCATLKVGVIYNSIKHLLQPLLSMIDNRSD